MNFKTVEQEGMNLKQQEKICKDYQQGKSIKQLAKEAGCGSRTINRLLERENIPIIHPWNAVHPHKQLKFINCLGFEDFFNECARNRITFKSISNYFGVPTTTLRYYYLKEFKITYHKLKKDLGFDKKFESKLDDNWMLKMFGITYKEGLNC